MYQVENFFAPSVSPGLNIFVETGEILINGQNMLVLSSIYPMVANSTNYVYLNTSTGAILSNSSGFPASNCYPIATVITGNQNVTSLTDSRADVAGSGGGGGGDVTSVFGRTGAVTAEANDYASVPGLTLGDGSGAVVEFPATGDIVAESVGGSALILETFAELQGSGLSNLSLDVGSPANVNFELENGAGSCILQNPSGGSVLNVNCGPLNVSDGTGSVWSSATGGSQGPGTINAKGLYVNGTAVGSYSFFGNTTNPLTALADPTTIVDTTGNQVSFGAASLPTTDVGFLAFNPASLTNTLFLAEYDTSLSQYSNLSLSPQNAALADSGNNGLYLGVNASTDANFRLQNAAGSAIVLNLSTGSGSELQMHGGPVVLDDSVGTYVSNGHSVAPTGGSQGAGTLNAYGLYVNGAAVATVPSGSANEVYATPTGSSGSASLRALVGADLPSVYNSGVSGFFGGFGGFIGDLLPAGSIANETYTANTAFAYLMYVPAPVTITTVTIWCTTGVASTHASSGIYNTGGSKLVDSGTFATTSSGVALSNTIAETSVTLQPGWYWYVFTVSSASVSIFSYAYSGTLATLINKNATRMGTGTATSGGALNTSLGSLSAGNNGSMMPLAFFE
jgi:hypothetical protein